VVEKRRRSKRTGLTEKVILVASGPSFETPMDAMERCRSAVFQVGKTKKYDTTTKFSYG
jgi:hypothetical protein